MKLSWIVLAATGLALVSAGPALAKKHRAKHVAQRCNDAQQQFTWGFLEFGGPAPRWNGCSPPVYNGTEFVGQDPDFNIRAQLRRDPDTGHYMRKP
ncbi:MAG: hypothetical protein ABI830_00685 [Pseudolabrys sp.]